MPGAVETVKLQVELIEKNAEQRLKALDKLAKEMGNRKITLNFDEASLAKWKTATDGMTNAQLSAYAKLVTASENASAKIIAAGQRTAQEEMKQNAKLIAERQKSFDKKVELYEKEDTKRRQAAEKTAQTEINANAKVVAAAEKGASSTRKHTAAQKELNTEAEKTSGIFDSLTARFSAANIVSSLVTSAISKISQAVRQAITDLKEMDKELTTIKMVSAATSEEIGKIRESAYEGAIQTGRSVTDYLSAYEMFTRAGYRENVDDLTKLALITQNIGGVEEEVASKFLLAADAAWKLSGSYNELKEVLDGVSSVADQNATDLGKIAEGITIAGSAMANAGVSAKEFTAMLGLTTASTQRSGSEMARGLRTILFRVRQVKAEFDDGEVINAEDISNAAKALKEVANIDVIDSQTNDLKSFSDIMSELAEKWVTLDDKQKQYLQNALAGNRQGNVLFAWLENWDKYQEMLGQYEDSSTESLRKNYEYTKSWEAATNDLSTSWTHLTDAITRSGGPLAQYTKALADFLETTALIVNGGIENDWEKKQKQYKRELEQLEKDWKDGSYFMSRTKYEAEKARLEKKIKEWNPFSREWSERVKREKQEAEEEAGGEAEGATNEIKKYTDAVGGAAGASEDAADKIDEVSTAFSKQKEAVEAVKKAIGEERDDAVNSIADVYKAMNEAAKNGYFGSKAFTEGGGLFFSKEVLNDIKSGKNNPLKEAMDAYMSGVSEGKYSASAAKLWKELTHGGEDIIDENGKVIASMKDLGDSYEWTFNRSGKSMDEFLQSMESSTGLSKTFWASLIESLGMYSEELGEWTDSDGKPKEVDVDTDEATTKLKTLYELIESIPDKDVQITVTTIYKEQGQAAANQYANSYYSGMQNAPGYGGTPKKAGGKHDNYSGIALVNDEFPANGSKPELIISKSSGRAYIANGGRPALVNLRSDDIVLTAKETKSALGIPGFQAGKGSVIFDARDIDGGGGIPRTHPREKEGSPNYGTGGGAHEWEGPSGGSTGTGSTGTGTAETPKDDAGNNGNGGKKKNADKEWEQLKKLVEYLLDKADGELQKALKALDDQLKELEAQRKAQKEANELEEKNLAVQNALLDLEKAHTERTVRYYNETTGQWEWMADQSSVEKAKEAYEDAQKDLADYLDEQAYEQQKAAIEAQKEELQAQYDAYRESWTDIVDAIEAPSGDLQALLETLKKYGSDTMKEQSGGIGDLLNNLREGILNPGYFLGLTRINANTSKTNTDENTVFDSGGFASGTGLMRKGSVGTETVIGPDITSDILNPVKNARFTSFVDSLRYLVGGESPIYRNTGSVTNNNGGNYYINGVKVGSDMAQRPFAEVMRTIAIHANETA